MENILDSRLIITIDMDINKGDYKKWLERIPNSIYVIFKKMLEFGPKLTLSDFTTFSKHGIDFEKFYDYPTIYTKSLIETTERETRSIQTNTLYYLAENKRYEELEILVKNFYRKKTIIKKVLENGYNILEVILSGIKRGTDLEDIIYTEKCIYIIETHFNIESLTIQKWIIDTMCGDYIKYSLYLKDILNYLSNR